MRIHEFMIERLTFDIDNCDRFIGACRQQIFIVCCYREHEL